MFEDLVNQVHQALKLTPFSQDQIRDVLYKAAKKLDIKMPPHWDDQLDIFDQVAFQDESGKTRDGYVSSVIVSEAGPDAIQLHYQFTTPEGEAHDVEHIGGQFFKK
jgi:hypothetical protein